MLSTYSLNLLSLQGEDEEEAGGILTQADFLAASSTHHCGKMAALEKLMELWAGERATKVKDD